MTEYPVIDTGTTITISEPIGPHRTSLLSDVIDKLMMQRSEDDVVVMNTYHLPVNDGITSHGHRYSNYHIGPN